MLHAPSRDLASPALWEDSLERSRRRRVLAAQGRREIAKKKHASAAVSAAMVVTQAAPAVAAAAIGGGGGPKVAQSSPANRAIAPGAPSELLRIGSKGAEVVRIQSALGVTPDGVFGTQTDLAVRGFQQRSGLAADGIVGPHTWGALFGGASGASWDAAKPRYGFSIQKASDVEAARVRPSIGGKGPVAKIVVRTVPKADGAAEPASRSKKRSAAPRREGRSGETRPVAQVSTPERGERESRSNGGREPRSAPAPQASPPRGNVSCGSDRLIAPVRNYTVTGQFGESRPGHRHAGLDLAAPSGTPIVAAACGVVTEAGYQGGYGNIICVRHSASLTTCYAHLSRFGARVGERVRQGEVIGYVGSTGNSSGPHVHFETRVNGSPTNPAPYISGGRRAKVTEHDHDGEATASRSGTSHTSASTSSSGADAPAQGGTWEEPQAQKAQEPEAYEPAPAPGRAAVAGPDGARSDDGPRAGACPGSRARAGPGRGGPGRGGARAGCRGPGRARPGACSGGARARARRRGARPGAGGSGRARARAGRRGTGARAGRAGSGRAGRRGTRPGRRAGRAGRTGRARRARGSGSARGARRARGRGRSGQLIRTASDRSLDGCGRAPR